MSTFRLEQEKSPVVFCHNDLQEGNILLNDDRDKENNLDGGSDLIIIGKISPNCFFFAFNSCIATFSDFEYCSYNYRGFDIANHFIEWVYNYSEPNYPYYKEDLSNYPTEKQRLNFVKAYLNERGSREQPKKLLKEVEVFTLATNFFWALWAFVNAETSQIPFGYWVSRLIVV